MKTQQNYSTVNNAVEFAKLKRDVHKGAIKHKAERYHVSVKDDKGYEYVIRYFS